MLSGIHLNSFAYDFFTDKLYAYSLADISLYEIEGRTGGVTRVLSNSDLAPIYAIGFEPQQREVFVIGSKEGYGGDIFARLNDVGGGANLTGTVFTDAVISGTGFGYAVGFTQQQLYSTASEVKPSENYGVGPPMR